MRGIFTVFSLFVFNICMAQPKGENYYFHYSVSKDNNDKIMTAENLTKPVNIGDGALYYIRGVLNTNAGASLLFKPAAIPLTGITPFLAVSCRWTELEHLPENTHVQIRFSKNNNQWSGWEVFEADEHAANGSEKNYSHLLFADENYRWFQLKITTNLKHKGLLMRSLMVNFFNPGKIQAPAAYSNTPQSLTNKGDITGTNDPQTCPCPLPAYKSRTVWGCPQGQGLAPGVTVASSVTHLIVHHSAGSNTSSDWNATVLSIWNSHVNTNGWSDIGYNWLVAPNGDLYEGRGGGNNVIGAHFCGTNGNTMGTCMLGTYTSVNITDTARGTLVRILGWKCCNSSINPTAQSFHASSGLTLFNISGHRDGCATECPGNQVYASLPQIRTAVQDYVTACAPCPVASNAVITASPANATACNGDSVQLTVSATGCTGCTYSWSTGATTASIWVKTAGTYTAFIGNSCGTLSAVKAVTITPGVTPTVQISYTGCPSSVLQFTPNPVNGGASPVYAWYVNNVQAQTGASFSLNPAVNGDAVYCRMTSNAVCPLPAVVQSATETINCITTAVIEIEDLEYLNVSPNPASDMINVNLKLKRSKMVQLNLRNAAGALLMQLPAERLSGAVRRQFNASSLAAGTYYAEVMIERKRATVPVVVKR
jgi:hypothetical protein